MSNCLFIFIDESGNFDFSPKGSKYFILTSISSLVPTQNRESFLKLRYKLLSENNNLEYFHATEDKQTVRDNTFELISKLSDFEIDSVIAQKNKAHPSLYKEFDIKKNKSIMAEYEFYRIICQNLLQYICHRYQKTKVDQIVIVLSSIFTNNKRQIITKSLKKYLINESSIPFNIYFHSSQADINNQISDYCCWAIAVKHERNELRPYQIIKSKIKSEFDIFRMGKQLFY